MTSPLTVIVLAAGAGTRMRSARAKVLHEIGGRTLLGHAVAAVEPLAPEHLVVVVGHQAETVGRHATALSPRVTLATQRDQRGTGDAVRVALDTVEAPADTVLVTYGDVPLLQTDTLRELLGRHQEAGAAVSVLTARLLDPTGYGRIVRDPAGDVVAIVEQPDADADQRSLSEVNSGIFAFDAVFLGSALDRLTGDNAQGELYLTDVVGIARQDGRGVGALLLDDVEQTEGVNDRVQLARLGAELNRRLVTSWMREGVTVVDPATTWIDADVVLQADVTLLPGVQLHGASRVGVGAVVGPETTLTDVVVGPRASVTRTHGSGAVIGEGASVGPYAYLRPGTELAAGGKIGTFVETKNSRIGPGAKVPHLSYVGDATIGEGTNIGAGTITANYDGLSKHRTSIGRNCSTGSDNVFVAPVSIGDGAVTGAGTVVRSDVPAGALAVSAGVQRHLEDWVARKRPGSAADRAAQLADTSPPDPSGDLGHPSEEPFA
ncbi:MAG: bifunctional UDP-N-acetylglucosamine diphosphorylase/glucosamine-1-phosphate N-acetyltransferase GlmU [Nocardioidaceae bacterium]